MNNPTHISNPLPAEATQGNAVRNKSTGTLVRKPSEQAVSVSDKAIMNLVGHNSKAVGGVEAVKQKFIQIEKLDEAIKQLRDQQKAIYADLREDGMPTAPARQIVNLRKKEEVVQKNWAQDLIVIDDIVNDGLLFGKLVSTETRRSLFDRMEATEGKEPASADPSEEVESASDKPTKSKKASKKGE